MARALTRPGLSTALTAITASVIGIGLVGSCSGDDDRLAQTGLEALAHDEIRPGVIVPGTVIEIDGRSFLDAPLGISFLRLVGTYAGGPLDTQLPAEFLDFEHMVVRMTPPTLALLGAATGDFTGTAAVEVVFTPDGSMHSSIPSPWSLEVRESIEPSLDELDVPSTMFVNEPIEVTGDGLLLGGDEGRTVAVVEGCFTQAEYSVENDEGELEVVCEASAECQPVGPTSVDVVPLTSGNRDRGVFLFSPRIAGICPGSFDGSVLLENQHGAGETTRSETLGLAATLAPTTVGDVSDGGSLGQFIDVQGGGFVGGDEGLTILRFDGTYIPEDAVEGAPVEGLELIPEFVDGRLVRYVLNEEDPLGQAINLRNDIGAFDGFITPIIRFGDEELSGQQSPVTFRIEAVKQVVWVQFNSSYVESLRGFGLRAVDSLIRDRIIAVLERDYAGINVEFRTEEPPDYKLYATIDIAGPDPNGLGLLGYDNTPGKDINNERLFDRIGGVNALTQEDGFPGFGGVFIESLFTYSEHPPDGPTSEVAVPVFDDIFDPFRPDRGGEPISGQDFLGEGVPELTSGGSCPAGDRRLQAACAIWVLGSVVGSTVSHELGHSLGLADPLGSRFHNVGDAPGRLMDAGGNRSFEERAQLAGLGPSIFCIQAYDYLRGILPTDAPDDLEGREGC